MSILSDVKKILNRGNEFSLGHKRVLRDILNKTGFSSGLSVGAGTGITTGTGTVYKNWINESNGVVVTNILIDLTGLNSGGTAGDIIGVDATANSHLGRITTAECGTLVGGRMTCLELVAGGEPNIDLWCATEATGTEDAAISALTETALLESSGDWVATGALTVQGFKAVPASGQYLYLVAGDATSATYTAGQFLIEIFGYR